MANQDQTQKQNSIIAKLQKKAEELEFGTLTVEFKIQDGKITSGEVTGERYKLG